MVFCHFFVFSGILFLLLYLFSSIAAGFNFSFLLVQVCALLKPTILFLCTHSFIKTIRNASTVEKHFNNFVRKYCSRFRTSVNVNIWLTGLGLGFVYMFIHIFWIFISCKKRIICSVYNTWKALLGTTYINTSIFDDKMYRVVGEWWNFTTYF